MLPVVTNTGYKKRLDTGENKQNGNTCTSVPARKGNGTITSCGIPSRIPYHLHEIKPGTAVVHTYSRPEKEALVDGR